MTSGVEGYQRSGPNLQELLGPVEITGPEKRRPGTPLGIGRRKEDSASSHPPQQGERSPDGDARRYIRRTTWG